MSKHKTKIFKKVFLNNSDCYMDTRPDDFPEEKGKVIPAMTEETFVPLMGQMWDKAKAKYRKRNERNAIAFAKYISDKINSKTFPKGTWEEIYKNWKNET